MIGIIANRIKIFLKYFFIFIIGGGICGLIAGSRADHPIFTIYFLMWIIIPVLIKLKNRGFNNSFKKQFAKEIAEEVKSKPELFNDPNTAVVFSFDRWKPEVYCIRLASKELYEEEAKIQSCPFHNYLHHEYHDGYKLNSRNASDKEKLKIIVYHCAKALGKDYKGFVHYIFSGYGGGMSNTYSVTQNNETSFVKVSEVGGGSYYMYGIVCRKEFYNHFKKHICSNDDGFTNYKKHQRYKKKKVNERKVW